MRRVTNLLDLFGAAGLSVAAGFAFAWEAGVAVASVAALLASWRLTS